MNTFSWNGINCYTAMGLYIEERPQPCIPERRYEAVQVDGRDDTLYIDKGSYSNVPFVYKVFCDDIDRYLPVIKSNFSLDIGYQKLTDTYNPDGYRRAFLMNPIQFTEEIKNFGHANVEFSADPWFYLNNGENETDVLTTTKRITNPEPLYTAKPLITANGSAGSSISLYIQSREYTFKIPDGKTSITIDCQNETAYSGNDNACKYLLFEKFPYLDDKATIQISRIGGTSLKLKPRWRRL